MLGQLQERARRLEQEMAALRADLDQAADMLARPCPNQAAQELALADRLAERDKNLPEAEIRRLLGEEIEAIRTEAIAKGVAIDDPIEAVIDD